jgi:hypothetical protein
MLGLNRSEPDGKNLGKRRRRRRYTAWHRKIRAIKGKSWIPVPLAWGGGESGIRTHDTVSRIHAFQASAFSHSAISPKPANRAGGPRNIAAVRRHTTRTGTRSHGTISTPYRCYCVHEATNEDVMGRGLLLWLLGIPLPIILLIWVLGGLHG